MDRGEATRPVVTQTEQAMNYFPNELTTQFTFL